MTDERVIRVSVEHWGLPEGAATTVAWDPVRVGRDAVAGSTCGIWRARVASASESISLIVKILHLADTGSRLWPASEKPSDPMYWRREADALRAFEAEQLPGPFQDLRLLLLSSFHETPASYIAEDIFHFEDLLDHALESHEDFLEKCGAFGNIEAEVRVGADIPEVFDLADVEARVEEARALVEQARALSG